jgi:hypothetical protein
VAFSGIDGLRLGADPLRSTKTKGHFLLARKMTASAPELQLWLLEALLAASAADEIVAQQLLRLPESFPFTLSVGVADLRKHEGFNIHRQGLDMDMVALRKVKVEQPEKPARRRGKAKPKKTATGQPSLFDGQADEVAAVDGQRRTPADVPFAAPIAECVELVREGRFYAGLALGQVIVEAAVLMVWRVRVRKRKNQSANFSKALDALHSESLIGDECKHGIEQMWVHRYVVPQLRPSVDSDKHLLEETAQISVGIVNDLATKFFGYSQRDGVIIPDHPEYWSASKEETPVLAGHSTS